MDARLLYCLIVYSAFLASAQVTAQIITPPSNVTVRKNETVEFKCEPTSPKEIVQWAKYNPMMETLYASPTLFDTSGKYEIANSSSLIIKSVDVTDGLSYSCQSVTIESRPHPANLVVIDHLKARIHPGRNVSIGDNVTLICILRYGAPSSISVFPLSPDQQPKLSMFLGNENLTSQGDAEEVTDGGSQTIFIKRLNVTRLLTSADVEKQLHCRAHSDAPYFRESVNASLRARNGPLNIYIYHVGNGTYDAEFDEQFELGTELNCSAEGNPPPRVRWISNVQNPDAEFENGNGYSVMKLTGTGFHQWICTATDTAGNYAPIYLEVNCTVVDPPSGASSDNTAVGLGVGLGIGLGLLALLLILLLVFFLQRRKSKTIGEKNSKANGQARAPMLGTAAANKSQPNKSQPAVVPTEYKYARPPTNNGVSRSPTASLTTPVMQEQVSAAPPKPTKDRPGYGDLGVKSVGATGSMPHLNESFNSDADKNRSRDSTRSGTTSRNGSSYEDEQGVYHPRNLRGGPVDRPKNATAV